MGATEWLIGGGLVKSAILGACRSFSKSPNTYYQPLLEASGRRSLNVILHTPQTKELVDAMEKKWNTSIGYQAKFPRTSMVSEAKYDAMLKGVRSNELPSEMQTSSKFEPSNTFQGKVALATTPYHAPAWSKGAIEHVLSNQQRKRIGKRIPRNIFVLLEGVQDTMNAGRILQLCHSFGLDHGNIFFTAANTVTLSTLVSLHSAGCMECMEIQIVDDVRSFFHVTKSMGITNFVATSSASLEKYNKPLFTPVDMVRLSRSSSSIKGQEAPTLLSFSPIVLESSSDHHLTQRELRAYARKYDRLVSTLTKDGEDAPCLIVFGNEQKGPSMTALHGADAIITIPHYQNKSSSCKNNDDSISSTQEDPIVDSLNVSVAASIILQAFSTSNKGNE